jgi:CheY-like chemotaxis protein
MEPTRIRAFVVDDEPIIASTLAAILRTEGYAAWSFTDPVQAMETALLEPPDVLVCDVVMPTVSGIELASQVKSVYPGCRIVLFSALAALGDSLRDTEIAAANPHILAKPVHPTVLLALIEQELSGPNGFTYAA